MPASGRKGNRMYQNGYESENIPGFGQQYNTQQPGNSPLPAGGSYFASNQGSGFQTGTNGYQTPQTGGYQVNATGYPGAQAVGFPPAVPGYQAPQTGGYQMPQTSGYQNQMPQTGGFQTASPGYQTPQTGGGYQAGVPGYQPPQTGGYQMPGYFSQAAASGSQSAFSGYNPPNYRAQTPENPYGGQVNSGYPPYGNGYSSAVRLPAAGSGSYIPPTPYSMGNTNPDYRPMQVGYQQGYSAISQMGRVPQTTSPQKTTPQQMPLNGGGYTPERVRVKRRPFEITDPVIYATGAALILVFALAMFVFKSSTLKILFLLLAGGTTAALWVKPLTAENKRLCYTIVALALCIATIVSLITSGGNAKDNNTSGNGQSSSTVQQTPAPTSIPQATAVTGNYTSTGYGSNADSAEEDEATKQRLYLFLQYWNANRLDEMLTLCAPSWVSKQESPKTALFQILKNRTPINFEILDLKGTSQDKSRQIILKCEIDRHTGKGTTVWYQLSVIMLNEGEQWYVDPLSIQTNEVEETPDPNVTPTPAPTQEPTYDANTVLYYNPDGGSLYHLDPNCIIINAKYLPLKGHFTYGQINDAEYAKFEPCNVCNAPLREQ